MGSHLFEGIFVDKKGIQRVQELTKVAKTRIIFVPTYKSFADPFVLLYINCFYNIELGFSFGNYEDSPKTKLVESICRRIGHLLIKREEVSNLNVNYVNQALM